MVSLVFFPPDIAVAVVDDHESALRRADAVSAFGKETVIGRRISINNNIFTKG